MTPAERQDLILDTYLEGGFHCAVDIARRLYQQNAKTARVLVLSLLEQVGEKPKI